MSTVVIAADIGGLDGYHAGDEAMLAANLDGLRRLRPGVGITAISRDPEWTSSHYGVRAIPPLGFSASRSQRVQLEREVLAHAEAFRTTGASHLSRPGAAVIEALAGADALVLSGGGNLCSRWPDQIHDRATLTQVARLLGTPTVVLGQTIGPHLEPDDRDRLTGALSYASLVGVRGAESADLVRSLGIPTSAVVEQLDDAWFLNPSPSAAAAAEAARHHRPWIAVTLAPLRGDPGTFLPVLESLGRQLSALARTLETDLVFVPHWNAPPGSESDGLFARRLFGFLDGPHDVTLLPVLTGEDICWLTRRADLVVSSRYHPLVFGLSGGVPCVAIHPDEHTRVRQVECLRHADLTHHAIGFDAAVNDGLVPAALAAWQARDSLRQHLDARTAGWRADDAIRWGRVAHVLGWADAEPLRPSVTRPAAHRPLDISAVVLTRNGAARLDRCLKSIVDAGIARELVVFVDGATTDTSESVARRYATRVVRLRTHGFIEFSLAEMAAACAGDFILRIDDDETLGGDWNAPVPESNGGGPFTHFMTPRRWLVPGLDAFLSGGDWFPDLQLRLFRNDPALIRWPAGLHEHLSIDGPRAVLWDRWIDHHVLWQQSRAERAAKCLTYKATRPDKHLSHFYLWEEQAVRLSSSDPNADAATDPLDSGADVSFGSDGHTAVYRLDGWSHAESWGTWTDGPLAVLRLPLRRPPTGPVHVVLEAGAFVRADHPTLRVTVSCAERVLAEWRVDTADVVSYAVTVPADLAVGAGVLVLALHIDTPKSPGELEVSPDERRLGLGVRRLRLTSQATVSKDTPR